MAVTILCETHTIISLFVILQRDSSMCITRLSRTPRMCQRLYTTHVLLTSVKYTSVLSVTRTGTYAYVQADSRFCTLDEESCQRQ